MNRCLLAIWLLQASTNGALAASFAADGRRDMSRTRLARQAATAAE